MSNFPINAEQFRSVAKKAVVGYVKVQFPKFFSSDDVEDMTSEVVCRMWRSRDTFNPEKGELSTWVRTIAVNVVKTFAKAKSNRANISYSYDTEDYQDMSHSPMEADAEVLGEEAQWGMLNHLSSERDQMMFNWKLEGYSSEEIAKRAGVTLNTVYLVFHHLKKKTSRAA